MAGVVVVVALDPTVVGGAVGAGVDVGGGSGTVVVGINSGGRCVVVVGANVGGVVVGGGAVVVGLCANVVVGCCSPPVLVEVVPCSAMADHVPVDHVAATATQATPDMTTTTERR